MPTRPSQVLATLFLLVCIAVPAAAKEENAEVDPEEESFWSQFKDPDDGMFDMSQYLLENLIGFMPVPIIITEPAVDDGLGLAGVFFHPPKGDQMKPDAEQNMILPNMSVVAAAYTGNESWFAGAGHFRNWSKDRYRYGVMAGYANINLDWYGNDDFPLPINGVRFNVEGAMLDQDFMVRFANSRWFLGAGWRYLSSDVTFKPNLPITLPTVENTVSGISAIGLFENLDSRLSPRRGFKTELRATANNDAIGSDFDYEEFSWQVRQYFEIGEKFTLSWRLDGATTRGDVPFYLAPSVQIQGIPALRYQGETAATAEIRGGYDVRPRWTVLGFVGAGRTADSISDLASATTRSSYGVGFRYLMAKILGMRVGIDVARGPEGTYVYLVMGSAWNTSGF